MGLVEAFKLPLKEIYARFTRSEVMLLGWRSAEMAHNMRATPPQQPAAVPQGAYAGVTSEQRRQLEVIEEQLGPTLIAKLENEEGQVDMRKLTGPEALRYMAAMGMPVPVVEGTHGSK